MLLVSLLALSGCVSIATSKKSAVEAVFQQRAQVKAQFGKSSNVEEMADHARQLVAGLKAINVQDCPVDFRAAWFDYLVDVDDTNTKHVRLAQLALQNGRNQGDLGSLAKLLGAALTFQAHPVAAAGMLSSIEPKRSGDKNIAVAQQMLDAQQRLDDSWRKLLRIAMNYGVTPER